MTKKIKNELKFMAEPCWCEKESTMRETVWGPCAVGDARSPGPRAAMRRPALSGPWQSALAMHRAVLLQATRARETPADFGVTHKRGGKDSLPCGHEAGGGLLCQRLWNTEQSSVAFCPSVR